MENESNKEEEFLDINVYKIQYDNQNYKISPEYMNWKKKEESKMGANGTEIRCPIDNILIYTKRNECFCPICRKKYNNCPYCNITRGEYCQSCCIKSIFNIILTSFRHNLYELEFEHNHYFFVSLIPLAIPFLLTLAISFIFYSSKKKNYDAYLSYIENEKKNLFNAFRFFIVAFPFLISISFCIFFWLLYLLLIIISLPFKLYFIRVLFCMFDGIFDAML